MWGGAERDMATRRTLRILLVVGAVLVVAGIAAVVMGSQPTTVGETDYLPPGWIYYMEFPKAVVAGGTIQGTWQTENGTPAQVLVYNDADYGAYVNNQNLTGLYNVTAVNGSLSLSVSGFDTYHVVIQHPAGYENTNLTFSVQLTMTGWDPTFTIGGILALVVGGVLLAYSVPRIRAPEVPSGTLPSRATIPMPPGSTAPPDTVTSGPGVFRVPNPLPGSAPEAPGTAGTAASVGDSGGPVGTVLVTVQNGSGADASFDLVVNGVPVTSMSVPAGQAQQVSVSAKLASPFGSTVTVEAVMASGRRVKQAVFVGARGTAPVTLHVG